MFYKFNIWRGKDDRGQVCTLLERWRCVWFLLSEFPYKWIALLLWTTLRDYLLRDSSALGFWKVPHHVWCDGRAHLRPVLPLSVIVSSRPWGGSLHLISVFATTAQWVIFGGHTLSHGLDYFLRKLLILYCRGALVWKEVTWIGQLLIRDRPKTGLLCYIKLCLVVNVVNRLWLDWSRCFFSFYLMIHSTLADNFRLQLKWVLIGMPILDGCDLFPWSHLRRHLACSIPASHSRTRRFKVMDIAAGFLGLNQGPGWILGCCRGRTVEVQVLHQVRGLYAGCRWWLFTNRWCAGQECLNLQLMRYHALHK